MATRATVSLSNQLEEEGASVETLCADFEQWKAGFPASEYKSPLFGKDGAYREPKAKGQPYSLRHVHLLPVKDAQALARWIAAHERGVERNKWGSKTSDRVLVYAARKLPGGGTDHLLLFILEEPDAHEIARMRTPENKKLMLQLATCAANFIDDGSITA